MNINTGKFKMTDEQKIYKYDQDLLLAKAMAWGARTQKESHRASDSRALRSEKVKARMDKEYLDNRKSQIGI
jgi:hypothetical protein